MATVNQFFDASVRLEAVIFIPGAVADAEATPEAFDDFCEDLPERADAPLYGQLPLLKRFAEEGIFPGASDLAELLSNTSGFLIQAAAPVRRYSGDASGWSWSWGHYYTAWLYAPTEAEIATVAIAWAEARGEADRAKAHADSRSGR